MAWGVMTPLTKSGVEWGASLASEFGIRGRETADAVLVIAFPTRADDRRWLVIDGKAGVGVGLGRVHPSHARSQKGRQTRGGGKLDLKWLRQPPAQCFHLLS
jgi:hypothetical protein